MQAARKTGRDFFGYSAVTGVVSGFSIGQLNQPVGTHEHLASSSSRLYNVHCEKRRQDTGRSLETSAKFFG